MRPEYENLVESYIQWLKSRTQIAEVDGTCEITTPFKDRHNDLIQIYVESKSGGYELNDDGYTISDLQMSGCGLTTPHRTQILDGIVRGFGVQMKNEVLYVDATRDNFPQRKHALIQAILTVNDMFMTAKHQVAKFFLEDVIQFLDANAVRYTPDVVFNGKSGLPHRFDFVIPRSKKHPERIIKAINNPNKDAATNLLFAWTDTKESRSKDSVVFAMINDTERQLSADLLSALQHYDVKTILWSDREKYAHSLAA